MEHDKKSGGEDTLEYRLKSIAKARPEFTRQAIVDQMLRDVGPNRYNEDEVQMVLHRIMRDLHGEVCTQAVQASRGRGTEYALGQMWGVSIQQQHEALIAVLEEPRYGAL